MAAGEKTLVTNRRARHEYFIEETYEAGIELKGTEVKSLRMGKGNLSDAYCMIRNLEVFLVGMHISPYEKGNIFNGDPLRDRRLLLHKQEIRKLQEVAQQKGLTLVPLRMYLKAGRVKLEVAVARGKKLYDKRATDAQRSAQRDMDRSVREYNR